MATKKLTINELRNIVKQVIKEEKTLNEDILELKQMSKQIYSFLKQEGYLPRLDSGMRSIGKDDVNTIIVVEEKTASVYVTPWAIARVLVGGGDRWSDKAGERFGDNWDTWFDNNEIKKHGNDLGAKILEQIKEKYPKMAYRFRQLNNKKDSYYILDFGYTETSKGGSAGNTQQNINKPRP